MIPDTDPFAPLLHQFLNVNYETEERHPDYSNDPNPYNPLIFFDRHIASTLQLKSIKRAPWIPKELGKICEDTIRQFTAEGHSFIENAEYWSRLRSYPISGTSSEDVAEYHFERIASPCNAYASKLLFHPDDPVWFSFMASRRDWSTSIEHSFYRSGDTAIVKPKETDTGNRDYRIPLATRQTLDSWVLPAINKLRDLPGIFNYEFYIKAKKAEALLEKMGPCPKFKWEIPTVTGAPGLPESSPPLDSPIIKSLFPSLGNVAPRTPSSQKKTTSPNTVTRKRKLVAPLRSTQGRESQYRTNCRHNIQKAWVRAVEKDVTFIVFSCGRLERIGIRHRESQTLYLSDLIDPAQWKNPGYGQMHLGLVLAATKDRLAVLNQQKIPHARPLKRNKSPSAEPAYYNNMKDKATRRKRRKLNPELELISFEMDKKTFNDELAKRDLVIVYLNYGIRQSPAPSSFRRMEPSCVSRPFNFQSYDFKRKPAYPPESYISVTANQKYFGNGAMGIIYRVEVEIEMSCGSKYRRNLILKLAIGVKKEQIIQEYEIYKRLAEAGVTYGIVGVHGLFHDMETGAKIMIMDDAGISLRERAIQRGLEIDEEDSVETTEEERDEFVKALEGIHSANVFHRDLRIDNLMINEDGEVFIIDFDSGQYDPDPFPYKYKDDMMELMSTLGWQKSDSADDEDESEDESEDEEGENEDEANGGEDEEEEDED